MINAQSALLDAPTLAVTTVTTVPGVTPNDVNPIDPEVAVPEMVQVPFAEPPTEMAKVQDFPAPGAVGEAQ
jgi:hypothetical protein